MTRSWTTSSPGHSARTSRPHLERIMWAWFFGAGWLALVGGAPMMRFAEEMGFGRYDFSWGLLSAMPYIATLFQLFGSYWIERTRNRKSIFFVGNLIQRGIWLVVAAMPFLFFRTGYAAVAAVLALVLVQSIGGQVAVPSWTSWMSDVIPPRLRGRYFSRRHRLGLSMSISVSVLSGWLLSGSRAGRLEFPWPTGLLEWHWSSVAFGLSTLHLCSILFVAASVLGIIDILYFWSVPDRPKRRLARPPGLGELFGPPLRNVAFRRFLLFYSVLVLGAPGVGNYIWRNAYDYLHVSDVWAQMIFMVAPAVGALLFAGTWGHLIDRVGRKTVWMIAALFPVFLPLCWVLIRPDYWFLGLLIPFFGGISWNGIDQCNFNSLLHFTSADEGDSSYQAIFALAIAVAGACSGGLFALLAWLTDGVSVHVGGWTFNNLMILFVIASAIRGLAYFLLLPRVHDEGREPVRVAVRYAFTNLYSTIHTALSMPLRAFGSNPREASYDPKQQDRR